MKKQIKIVLQRCPNSTIPAFYKIVQLSNAAVIEWNNQKMFVGFAMREQEADSLARCKVYEVTVKM